MQPVLIAIKQDGTSQKVPLQGDDVVVGREHGCNLRLPLAAVSRKHCAFTTDDDGGVRVRDLGSSNGTYVNRQKVSEAELNDGDLVCVGPVVFAVALDGDTPSEDLADLFMKGRPTAPIRTTPAASDDQTLGERPLAADPDDPFAAAASEDDGPMTPNSDDSSFADFDFDFSDEEDMPSL